MQPPADTCHVCGSQGKAGDFWRSLLKKDLPDEGWQVDAIRSAASEIGFEDGAPSESGLREFFARHMVTSRAERELWTGTLRAYFSAYRSGLDLAQWELMHPPEKK